MGEIDETAEVEQTEAGDSTTAQADGADAEQAAADKGAEDGAA